MKYYKTNGTPNNNIGEFEEDYKKFYFLDGSYDKEVFKYLNSKNRSSRSVENEIKTILDNGIKNDDEGKSEIAKILAWKIGKIDHHKSEEEKEFVYISDWQNAEKLEGVKIVGKYPIKKAVEYILENKEELSKKDPKSFLNELKDKDIFKGIGTVYMTTLLYFLSKGKYPIYDRFAHQAAKAIYLEVNPNDVYVGFAPDKTQIGNFLKMYNEYCWLLKQIFSEYNKKKAENLPESFEDYSITREQDQALWVYGHACINKAESDYRVKEYKVIDFE